MTATLPPFLREIENTLAVHSQYVLHGNIRDELLNPESGGTTTIPMKRALWWMLRRNGYTCLLDFDLVHGLTVHPASMRAEAKPVIGTLNRVPSMSGLRPVLARLSGTDVPPIAGDDADRAEPVRAGRMAFILDYASRLVRQPSPLEGDERDFFLFCLKLAETAQRVGGGPPGRPGALFNPIIWLVDGEHDLPPWLVGGSERIRSVGVPHPDRNARTETTRGLAVERRLAGYAPGDEATDRAVEEFAGSTDGMTLRALREIILLAQDHGYALHQLDDATRAYKLGVEDTPWNADLRKQIRSREEKVIRGRVLGQEQAVAKTLDIVKRAALGLSGAQAASSGNRPRGVLFFAGPTGVGKTELAKAVAQLLFGTDDSYLRFDMSEFSAEHAADRLTGAPPGYVGFEAGGELTRAVRTQPFRVVLFDEIEKAHPRILDKFLQILEDGRLTDGHGVTTYFSECVLIFTSNLGVLSEDPSTGKKVRTVEPGTKYEDLEAEVRRAVQRHFTDTLGRPELLNRLGDNIVVFDFISVDNARRIFDKQLAHIADRVRRESGLELEVVPAARAVLGEWCTADPDNGGRGIGNALESALVNPLARHLFDLEVEPTPGSTLRVTNPRRSHGRYDLDVEVRA